MTCKFSKKYLFLILVCLLCSGAYAQRNTFETTLDTINQPVPWTPKDFYNDPMNFQFALISDRTGAHREGIFGKGIDKLNLVMPEFVISVGDLIEGGTSDLDIIHQEWSEFDSILNPLKMRYFFLPGNHDYSNATMAEEWKKKFGRDYYHFKYKNVLFLALNTMDDFVEIGEEQLAYFEKVLEENKDVRWTFVIMHHPLWHYREFNRFDKIEELLQGRDYSVFAGHRHRYLQEVRYEKNYMVLGTTGGGSRLRGAKMGEFDHVTWVTMDDKGPTIVNMTLDGLLEPDIASRKDQDKITALARSMNMKQGAFYHEDKMSGKVLLTVQNSGPDSIYFDGRIWHHHELDFDQAHITKVIPPHQEDTINIKWTRTKTERIDSTLSDIEIAYTVSYQTEKLDIPFEISGTQIISFVPDKSMISLSDPDILVSDLKVSLSTSFSNFPIHYTTDGSEPNASSPLYKNEINIDKTTTIKAALMSKDGLMSTVYQKTYTKKPLIGKSSVKRKNPGLSFSMYEGVFRSVGDYASLQPIKDGVAKDFDVLTASSPKEENFGLNFTGFINVPEDGLYMFKLTSDDESQVFIHDQLLVDNYKKPNRTAVGYILLEKGMHPIEIKYIERGGDQHLDFFYKVIDKMDDYKLVDSKMLWHSQEK